MYHVSTPAEYLEHRVVLVMSIMDSLTYSGTIIRGWRSGDDVKAKYLSP